MPLVIISGYPASGKSTVAGKIAAHLRGTGIAVELVDDHRLGLDHGQYLTSATEKPARVRM